MCKARDDDGFDVSLVEIWIPQQDANALDLVDALASREKLALIRPGQVGKYEYIILPLPLLFYCIVLPSKMPFC